MLFALVAPPGSRRLSTYQERLASEEVHAVKTKETWKKIVRFLIVCLERNEYCKYNHTCVMSDCKLRLDFVKQAEC